jgi:hypothetical protein
MLRGTASAEAWADRAPTLADFGTEPLTLPAVEVAQILYEIKTATVAELLPPALHPTLPGVLNWLAYHCPDSPWGEFRLVQARIECRSGVRPRTFAVSGFIDNAAAGDALTSRWGHRLAPAEIAYHRAYDGGELRVVANGRAILDVILRDPILIPEGVAQFLACLHPAQTPRGYRLVQVDIDYATSRSERARPELRSCDSSAWGDERLAPLYPVAAAVCTADVTIGALRYVCQTNELAFTGTERVD